MLTGCEDPLTWVNNKINTSTAKDNLQINVANTGWSASDKLNVAKQQYSVKKAQACLDSYNNSPVIFQWLYDAGGFLGFGTGKDAWTTKLNTANAKLNDSVVTAKTNAGEGSSTNDIIRKYWWLLLLIVAVIIGAIVLISLSRKRGGVNRVTTPRASAPAPEVQTTTPVSVNTTSNSRQIGYTEAEARAMCEQQGRDYNMLLKQCGSPDAVGHYLATGMSDATPW